MRELEDSLQGSNGTKLFCRSWLPGRPPSRVAVIAHGLAEHSGRYEHLAGRLVDHGFAVHALDHRGHGHSPGRRANIQRFDYVVEDLHALIRRAAAGNPGLPVTLIGHSMGGAIALECALRHPQSQRQLVLSAPALAAGEVVPPLQVALVRLLSALLPNTGALTLPAEALSRDPEVVRAYDQDPLVYRGAIPARTLAELFKAMKSFPESAPRLGIPVLVLHGTGDTVVPLAVVEGVLARLGPVDKTVHRYEGLYHEVFNEPERERVIGDLLDWLDARA
jgi:alpha-beta hydrolase superfamily lysophospholipase